MAPHRATLRCYRCDTHPAAKGRYRPKGVFGKGVGNSKNASEMRHKRFKMDLVLLGKEECVRNASKSSQKCVKNARNTFKENTFWTIPKRGGAKAGRPKSHQKRRKGDRMDTKR